MIDWKRHLSPPILSSQLIKTKELHTHTDACSYKQRRIRMSNRIPAGGRWEGSKSRERGFRHSSAETPFQVPRKQQPDGERIETTTEDAENSGRTFPSPSVHSPAGRRGRREKKEEA